MVNTRDVLIIGGGVAGLSAAIYTAREGFKTTVFMGFSGSAISLTSSIENYPGFDTQEGNALIEKLQQQAEEFGAEIVWANVGSVDTSSSDSVVVTTDVGVEYVGKALFIATGSVARLLGLEGEREHYGKGVSTCATCDGFFYKDGRVAVVGGGDTAIEDSLFLNKTFNTQVDLFVRGDKFRTNSPDARKLMDLAEDKSSSVNVHFETTIEKIEFGDNGGKSVITTNNGESHSVDGLFVAIGHDPATEFLKSSTVTLNDEGYIVTDASHRVTGEMNHRIWAAGDVVDSRYSQAITASGDAVKAAIEIRTFLNSESE